MYAASDVISSYVCPAAMFYYVLGNIHPKYRLTLAAIQLLTAVKHIHLNQYGIDKILEPFIEEVKELEVRYYKCMHGL